MKMKTTLTLLLITELYRLSSGIKQHYSVNDWKKSWDSAHNYCRTYFHDLSTFIDKKEQQQFLQDAARQTSDAWVGLRIDSELGIWRWSGGEKATQIIWDSGQPDGNDGCVYLRYPNKKLHDHKCSREIHFFCMTNFVLVNQKETWEGALEHCRRYHNDLASPSTKQRMDSALLEITAAETEYVWTGLRFLAGDWFWVSGDNFGYKAWNQNQQPQCPARDLRCGALDKQTQLWTHRDCDEKFSFLCQSR